jgi:hypothetical protein
MENDSFSALIILFALGIFLLKIGIDSIVGLFNKNWLVDFIAIILGSIIVAFSICFFFIIQFPKTFGY